MCPSLLLCLSCNGSRSQTAGVPQNNIYPLKNLAMRFLVRFPNPLPNIPRGGGSTSLGIIPIKTFFPASLKVQYFHTPSVISLWNCWNCTHKVEFFTKKDPNKRICVVVLWVKIVINALLLCKIVCPKIWSCNLFDKSHVWCIVEKGLQYCSCSWRCSWCWCWNWSWC